MNYAIRYVGRGNKLIGSLLGWYMNEERGNMFLHFSSACNSPFPRRTPHCSTDDFLGTDPDSAGC